MDTVSSLISFRHIFIKNQLFFDTYFSCIPDL